MDLDPVWASQSPVACRASFLLLGCSLVWLGQGQRHAEEVIGDLVPSVHLFLISGCKINIQGIRPSREL